MKVYTNGTDTIVAADEQDLRAVLVELYGIEDAAMYHDEGFVACDETETLTIVNAGDGGVPRTLTYGDWAATIGRGLLCSTEF